MKPSEDDYFATLDDDLQTGAYDFVATQEEYALFRRALMRWIEREDAAWDQIANDEEHGHER